MNLWTIFLTGLLTGGLTCLAVQGGLLAATLAQREEERLKREALSVKRKGNILPILSFLAAKIFAYTILGLFLGAIGSFFQFSLTARIILDVLVAVFMLGTAFNLLNLHPIFRYFVIQPPKFLTRLVRNQTKSGDLFAPAILGAFTIFIPCPTTQAMMALAIASGNAFLGATIMFVFVVGTSPLFFILGFLASRVGEVLHARFLKVAAATIILLAVFNINNAAALAGSDITLETLWQEVNCTIIDFCSKGDMGIASAAVDEATISLESNGYSPKNITLKAGSQVTLHLVNTTGGGCTQAFTIPRLGIQKVVPLGKSETITFTAPARPGKLAFMCGMGMYRGEFNII